MGHPFLSIAVDDSIYRLGLDVGRALWLLQIRSIFFGKLQAEYPFVFNEKLLVILL